MKEGETVSGNKCRASLYTQKQFSPTCPAKHKWKHSFEVAMLLFWLRQEAQEVTLCVCVSVCLCVCARATGYIFQEPNFLG